MIRKLILIISIKYSTLWQVSQSIRAGVKITGTTVGPEHKRITGKRKLTDTYHLHSKIFSICFSKYLDFVLIATCGLSTMEIAVAGCCSRPLTQPWRSNMRIYPQNVLNPTLCPVQEEINAGWTKQRVNAP